MNTKLMALAAPLALAAACSTQPATESAAGSQTAGASAPQAAVRPAALLGAGSGEAMKDAKGGGGLKVAKRSVYYDFDKFDIKPEHLPTVEANARYLRERQALKVRIEGNADERGSRNTTWRSAKNAPRAS